MSYINTIKCEGGACPMKQRCALYFPNRWHRPNNHQFFVSPPYARDYCAWFKEKQDAAV